MRCPVAHFMGPVDGNVGQLFARCSAVALIRKLPET